MINRLLAIKDLAVKSMDPPKRTVKPPPPPPNPPVFCILMHVNVVLHVYLDNCLHHVMKSVTA